MKRLLAVLFAVAVALPVAADTQVVCSISARAETACSAITVSQAGQLDQCRCNQNAPAPAGPFGGHATLADGLVSYWPLDEESGVRADLVGSNDLTDNNTVGYANTGPQGRVANYVKANSEELTTASTLAAADSTFAVAFWYWSPNNAAGTEGICNDANGDFFLRSNSGALNLYVRGYGASKSHAGANVGDSQWHFVYAYHDADTDTIGISVDGAAIESGATGGANGAIDTFAVGSRNGLEYATHKLSRFGAWTRLLTPSEITSLMAGGRGKAYVDLTAAEKVSLVSYWDLDEASGNRADSHGSNTLTDNNTVTSVDNTHPGFGKAASFVAANAEYLSVSTTDFRMSGDFSISLWLQIDASVPGGDYRILFVGTGSSQDYAIHRSAFLNNIRVTVNDSVSGSVNTARTASTDVWHHFIVSYNSTTKAVSIYIDGGTASTSAALTNGLLQTSDRLHLGHMGSTLDGMLLSSIAVWSRALTDQERTDLYNAGAGLFYED